MAKSTSNDSLDTVARLLDLVPFLTTHQGIALSDLATEFSVSVDQITKDLTTLWMCGLPGYTAYELIDLSFDTGFVTISNAETLQKPRALNRDEVLALLLGLESLREDVKDSDSHVAALITQSISRLSELIGTAVSRSVQSGDTSDAELLALIQRSISKRSVLRIKYHSVSRDEITERLIHPFDMSSDSKYTYVYAFCESSGGNRTFRLDRIITAGEVAQSAESIKPALVPEPTPHLDAKISISARKRDIAERLNLDLARSVGAQPVSVRCFGPEWAVREVMSFGGAAEVSDPQVLREEVLRRASIALAAYEELKP
jgi:proteasome accessory factor C